MNDSLYDIPVTRIDGQEQTLAGYAGKVLLIVNTASQCGFTPQYAGLEELYRQFGPKGLVVLGFPCNQFGGQEPGDASQIEQFCHTNYSVTFPMFDKLEVNGANRHPLYGLLAGNGSPVAGDIKWNFTKFLVGRDGKILKRFESKVKPDAPEVTQAIEAALAVHQGTAMINSISLEKERYEKLLPVVAGSGSKVVALCMSDEGMPETADQRMAIADQLINGLVKNNVALENIFVDPLVQPVE